LNTQDLSTLKIHKLTQAQYDRELAAGRIDDTAIYLTPNESIGYIFNVVRNSNYVPDANTPDNVITIVLPSK
jgi:hypothetical protein